MWRMWHGNGRGVQQTQATRQSSGALPAQSHPDSTVVSNSPEASASSWLARADAAKHGLGEGNEYGEQRFS